MRPSARAVASRLAGVLRRERWWILGFLALATCVRLPTVDGWDEAFYVAQLVSLVEDGDLRLQDDVVHVPRLLEDKHDILTRMSPGGSLANTFSIGPAVLLAPFTAPVISAAAPPPWHAFRAAAAVAAMVMLALTALLTASSVRRCGVSRDIAALATGLAILCGPLAVYGTRAYLNTHLGGALLVALTLRQALAWLASRRPASALAFGLAAGLTCVNRWQDAVIVAPLAAVVVAAPRLSARDRRAGLGLSAAAATLAVAIQLRAWHVQFGTPLLIPQGAGYMRWLEPAILPLTFSTYHGLVPWTPGFALGLVALTVAALGRRATEAPRPMMVALAVGVSLSLYVSACPLDWWGQASFGPRRLTSLVAPSAIGLGILLERTSAGKRWLTAIVLSLWAVVAVSAHFSRFEDVGILVAGRSGPFQPPGTVAAPSPQWTSRWGPFLFAIPGFSLSDAPRASDRMTGLLIVLAVVAALRVLWPLIDRRPVAQNVVAAALLAYLLAWTGTLASCPTNRDWNAQWRGFVMDPLDPSRLADLPPEMKAPALVVAAFRAAEENDRRALDDAVDQLRSRGFDVDRSDVVQAVAKRGPP
jgi:hypothetical protein